MVGKKLSSLLLLLVLFGGSIGNKYSKEANVKGSCSGSHCHKSDEGPCEDDGKEKLYRWDPIKVRISSNLLFHNRLKHTKENSAKSSLI